MNNLIVISILLFFFLLLILSAMICYLMFVKNYSERKRLAKQLNLNYIKGNPKDEYNIIEGKYNNRHIKIYDKYLGTSGNLPIARYLPKIEIDNKIVYKHWWLIRGYLSSKKIKKIIDKNIYS